MGTVEKKTPTKKAPEAVMPIGLTGIEQPFSLLWAALESCLAVVEHLPVGVLFPQLALKITVVVDDALKRLEAFKDRFKYAALKHHLANGKFAVGKVAVTFPETTKRSPSWKSEASRLAKELAELRGESFNEEAFFNQIQESYDPKTTTSVKLMESV